MSEREALARTWHALSDHAADGTPFGGGLCNCLKISERLALVMAEVWDEARKAKPQYLGPDGGHYADCMGWEDCCCASYPNHYASADA